MVTFISIYRGPDIPSARPIAVSVDPSLIAYVAARLLEERDDSPVADPALIALEEGRKQALRLISTEAQHEAT